jgi:hypothetical protein
MRTDSDDQLVRYLLGDLADDEAERLDERSITDDAFALRLREIENDLVDRYARGEPFDAALERFNRMYRASPHLREKVKFAQALHAFTATDAADRTAARILPPATWFGWRTLAAAAVLVLAAAGYVTVRNLQLRDELGQLEARRTAVEQQNAQLQQELERTRATPPPPRLPVTATFLLPPPRRTIGTDTTPVALARGTEHVTLRLQVESDDYSTFWAALRDLSTTGIVWRSGDLPAEASASDRIVTVTVPASSLFAQRYSIELSGVGRGGSTELVGHYLIRVVLE